MSAGVNRVWHRGRPGTVPRVIGRVVGFVVAVALVDPGVAAGADRVQGTVALYAVPGHVAPEGVQRVFDTARGDTLMASFDGTGWMHVAVDGDRGPTLMFATPDGKPLRPGVYTRTNSGAGRGLIGVDIEPATCGSPRGRFEVRSWSVNASGRLRRAWILFEADCGDGPVFGELRIGYPHAAVTPAVVRWPTLDVGRASPPVTVRVTRGRIASARITGAAAKDFAFAPGEAQVRFTPTAPGTRTASLRIRTTHGARVTVPLEGFAYGGTTGVDVVTEPGGAARHYDATAQWSVFTSPEGGAHGRVIGAADGFGFTFEPPRRQALAPGTYTLPPEDTGAGPFFEVSSGPCVRVAGGTFTVHELVYGYPFDAQSPKLSISFEERCEDTGAVRGTVNFRAGDMTRPARWMVERVPALDPNSALRTAIAIESRRHAEVARRFRIGTKDLRNVARGPATPVDLLGITLERDRGILTAATPTSARLRSTRRRLLRKLARETKLYDAFVEALRGDERVAKRARARILRELARPLH
jgi:predicted small integral membrane protein